MSKITNDGFNPVSHRMLYSCTHMATVDVKGLKYISCDFRARSYARNYAASLPTGLPDSQI